MSFRQIATRALAVFAFGLFCPRARADSTIEIAGSTGLGAFAVGVTPARFAVSPSASVSVRGDLFFFVARNTVSFLGANGGRFGINNETTAGGGLFCATPSNCVNKCVAKSKYCWAETAVHPYKPPMLGNLYDCIDSLPPASLGGSYTCLYRYPNGDACIFSYAAKLGPITFPAPPPLCLYKSP